MATSIEIYGFHGTTVDSARTILNEGFEHSHEGLDWLGDGIYFWQDAPERAWEWANIVSSKRPNQEPAVIGARIEFNTGKQEGDIKYIDLLDIPWEEEIEQAFDRIKTRFDRLKRPLPRQTKGAHRLDHMVIDQLVDDYDERRIKIPAVRAAFQEGIPIFEQSALYNRSHVQVAVKDQAVIFDKWIERGDV